MRGAMVVGGPGWMPALLLAAALAGAAPLEGQAARVLGRVTDGVGNPVAHARVALVAEDAAAPIRETVSGATGGFQFEGVPPGTYTLRAARDGYAAREVRVAVRPGRVVTRVVRLLPARADRAADPRAGAGRR